MPRPTHVRVDSRVLRGQAPIVYVAHADDDTWLLAAKGFTHRPSRAFTVADTATVFALDETWGQCLHLPRGWHAWRSDRRFRWKRGRMPRGRVHLLTYEVRSSAGGGVGAFVNAWVKRPSLGAARRAARSAIRRAGYRIVSADQEQEISLRECAPGGRPHFQQAEVDGEVLDCHLFPPDA